MQVKRGLKHFQNHGVTSGNVLGGIDNTPHLPFVVPPTLVPHIDPVTAAVALLVHKAAQELL